MARNFRELIPWDLPGWLQRGEGGRFAYLCALLVDAGIERVRHAVEHRFPSRTGNTGLAKIALDRGLIRGRTESSESFAGRLQHWRYPRGHRVRGNAFALLEQISLYFGGVACFSIDALGNKCVRAADGTLTATHGETWPWATFPEGQRRRFWIVVDSTGLTINPEDIAAVKRLLSWRPWKPAGTSAEWLLFAPGMVVDPDGWTRWSYNDEGTQRPLRSGVLLVSLSSSAANNYYTGDPTNFPASCQNPGPYDYTPSATNWQTSILVPGTGSVYEPNATNWQTSVRLFDDGDGI